MNPREEAISDCKYAISLGEVALNQHIQIWQDSPPTVNVGEEYEYWCTLAEIKSKLGSEECLLK
jgi:hypothetical protein